MENIEGVIEVLNFRIRKPHIQRLNIFLLIWAKLNFYKTLFSYSNNNEDEDVNVNVDEIVLKCLCL